MKDQICKECSGTGWIVIREGDREFAKKCGCQATETYQLHVQQANIPRRFQTLKLDLYKPEKNPSQIKAKRICSKFIEDYPAVSQGLLLQGPTGIGKTRLLCSVGIELINKKNVGVYYVDWNDLVREMRSGEDSSNRDFQGINQMVEKLTQIELLLFDEFGSTLVSPWVQDYIYYLVNSRYNNEKITLFATNFYDQNKDSKETLQQRVGDRIRSRLYEMTMIVPIMGIDFRQKFLEEAK